MYIIQVVPNVKFTKCAIDVSNGTLVVGVVF